MSETMIAEVVGGVYDRLETLAFVTARDGKVTRVRWRSSLHKGAPGYRCDVHGLLAAADDCPHALAASEAFIVQYATERDNDLKHPNRKEQPK